MPHDVTTPAPTDDEARWRIALAKDRRFDGKFVTGVHSTGIYCRPSCPAKPPRRENVSFYATPLDAEAAGLRACLRCRPGDVSRDEAAVAQAIQMLRDAEESVPLEELAAAAGYSPTHFQRLFKRAVGLSPAAFARALRMERAEDALSAGGRVTDAVYEAGFGAPSRFYEASEGRLGMTPSAWRDGGRARFANAELVAGGEDFAALFAEVVAAVEQPGDSRHIPLDVQGTAFQEAVWQELRRIPPGETRSYAEIAAAVGKPGAVRAAGSANGANNVAVLIPCHRVIRSDGTLGGYAYGLAIKQELLERERGGS
ncbi:MAG: methylated-DNA--[protein]-cysteine S-methyltransferase [Sphingomonadales bacterium]|nr:methylated-DNA--[protein]-cysteine S-methyltransferase [Sphingomonadales bacterium]